jgi:sulfite reductase (NADPH) hemoprotein beta-component
MSEKTTTLSPVEIIKNNSNYLRGSIKEGLADELTGSLAADDTQLTKFHGIYQQTARELDAERRKQKLEPLYSFMIRVRVPGGIALPDQYLEMDRLSDAYANGTLKLTTRQAFQFHGVYKRVLKQHIKEINDTLMDTIAACGDVNRNVMCSPNPEVSSVHAEAYAFSKTISEHLTPNSTAYHEIWLDKNRIAGGEITEDNEPIYGKTYLPRKFKIAIAVPPDNDTDIFTNDIGIIAVEENGKLAGYNIVAGGGMGNTFGDDRTHPLLAHEIGFYKKDDALSIVEEIVKIQRDNGNREDRKVARLKYTIERLGIDWFKEELEKQSGIKAAPVKPYKFTTTTDRYGWVKGTKNNWNYTLFVEHGRVKDTPQVKMKTALREIAKIHKGDFRLTGNQNIIIGNVSDSEKKKITDILENYKVDSKNNFSPVRLSSLACVALNTCTLAHSEAETYLPGLIDKVEVLLKKYNLSEQPITLRMTGCPNGCARPYNSEIGLVGRAPGVYNLYLGGSHLGKRLNVLYKEMLHEDDILTELDIVFEQYSKERNENEFFGDFVIRKGIVFVSEF